MPVSAFGAMFGLVLAIILIFRRVPPVYALITGAVLGGLVGGAGIQETVDLMMEGAEGIIPAVLRILAAGILAGVLIESGAAVTIATSVVKRLGEKKALLALVFATMLLTAVGVFVDVAVITVASIALAIAHKAGLSKTAILLAMVGGGKAGNIMSPNPNTIAVAEAFQVPLTSVMAAGIIPAVFGVIVTYILAKRLAVKGTFVENEDLKESENAELPSLITAIIAPFVAISLLVLRPLADIEIDPMIALPLGGLIGAIAMGKFRSINSFILTGLSKMSGVAVLLLGTGTIAGIITNSDLQYVLIDGIDAIGLPSYALAPASGIFMGGATASTTSGAVVAGEVFSGTLLELGISGLAGAAMVHAGATVIDHMPHGSFFHATAGSVLMGFKERLKIMPYESLVGLTLALISTLIFGVFQLF
ncbi:GntP family permease [Salisediminibacterium halotolerans]|uniref:GntP family permease n=1 Tax=Salisediminibacterium halotolerans TaxID=517425 RepID=UPI000EADCE42|nr:GntP family permease [Salisediminibacterium halotolerans]RLJ75672.1 GntP family gluconate:H+ symporter [Actinophytocola xinjiangensis]RPE89526.1 GntP family gluconate:H+ symporter [Salisediminibacterium halotolerans]TWG36285.1 GntP family gluconate:H+ symporter [Salisediminibacterium halotolerans]GEL07367.1 gluconate:proton symporter [Salisediminibacterium halotolerans]